jgi:histidine ammonia-lyase
MSSPLMLDGSSLTIESVVRAARDPGLRVGVDPAARGALEASRALVDRAVESGQTIYGINSRTSSTGCR